MATVTAWDLLVESELLLGRIRALKAKRPAWEVRAEAKLSRQIGELFGDVADEVLRELTRLGHVPADTVSRSLLMQAMAELETPFADILFDGALDAATHGRNRVIAELQRQGMSVQFTEFSEQVSGLIRDHVFEASQRTLDRIVGDVMENLAQSYEDGLGIDEAAERLHNVVEGLKDYEAKRIARTEINSRQNQGAHETIQELGVQYEQWIATDDDRTRESHLELDGVIVRTGDPFPLGPGVQYPGDFSSGADLSELISCRCRVRPIIPPAGAVPPPGRDWWYPDDWVITTN